MHDEEAVIGTAGVFYNSAVNADGKLDAEVVGTIHLKLQDILRRMQEGTLGVEWVRESLQRIAEGCRPNVLRHEARVIQCYAQHDVVVNQMELVGNPTGLSFFKALVPLMETVNLYDRSNHDRFVIKGDSFLQACDDWSRFVINRRFVFQDVFHMMTLLDIPSTIPHHWQHKGCHLMFGGTVLEIGAPNKSIPAFPSIVYSGRRWVNSYVPVNEASGHRFLVIKMHASHLDLVNRNGSHPKT